MTVLEEMLAHLGSLDDADLDVLIGQAMVERTERRVVESAPEAAAEIQAEAAQRLDELARAWHATQGGTGTQDAPVPYRPVTGPHTVWPADSWVTFDGATWFNPHPANSWAPGDVGSPWVRQDEPDPDTGHIAWAVGQSVKADDRRTHTGRLWRAKIDHVTHEGWAPSEFTHAVWEDQGPVEGGEGT